MELDIALRKKKNLLSATKVQYDSADIWTDKAPQGHGGATASHCLRNGYTPSGYGIADFSIIRMDNLFHLFYIPIVPGCSGFTAGHTHWLGHAVTSDFDTWTTLDPPLCVEPDNYYESAHIWAPFVFKESDCCYMYYTGLSAEPSQVLCMATSVHPDLLQWRRCESNPIVPLEGFSWQLLNQHRHTRHARDPHVIKVDGHYLFAYTSMHRSGIPAVGGLVSDDLIRWEDIGPILYRGMSRAAWLPESVNIQKAPDGWALLPSQSPGIEYYISDDPHTWHDSSPTRIEYEEGENDRP
jgi:predicted GH43/DUF377 family glycosyl hydrolase